MLKTGFQVNTGDVEQVLKDVQPQTKASNPPTLDTSLTGFANGDVKRSVSGPQTQKPLADNSGAGNSFHPGSGVVLDTSGNRIAPKN